MLYAAARILCCIGDPVKNVLGTRGFVGRGVAFALTPPASSAGAWHESVLHSFSNTDGFYPNVELLMSGGALYGTTLHGGGGEAGQGNVFKLTPPSAAHGLWTESNVYTFAGPDGSKPGWLIADTSGALYSTTGWGANLSCSPFGCGTVFKLMPPATGAGAWKRTLLQAFFGGRRLGAHRPAARNKRHVIRYRRPGRLRR